MTLATEFQPYRPFSTQHRSVEEVDLSFEKALDFEQFFDFHTKVIQKEINRSLSLSAQSLCTSAKSYVLFWFDCWQKDATTDAVSIDEETILDDLARTGNEYLVDMMLHSIPWEKRSAETFIHGIRAALAVGLHTKASELAQLGFHRFPQNPMIAEMAHLLEPTKIIEANLPANPDAVRDIQWLKENSSAYRGCYVALKAGQLLASGDSYSELIRILGNIKGTGILLTRVY